MKVTYYLCLSGGIFGLVSIGHLMRALLSVSIVVGAWEVPMWISWVGCPIALVLCVWAFTQAREAK